MESTFLFLKEKHNKIYSLMLKVNNSGYNLGVILENYFIISYELVLTQVIVGSY